MTTPLPPAGWFADPAGTSQLRFWSGTEWTAHLSPVPTPAPGHPGFGRRLVAFLIDWGVLTTIHLVVAAALIASVGAPDSPDPSPWEPRLPVWLVLLLGVFSFALWFGYQWISVRTWRATPGMSALRMSVEPVSTGARGTAVRRALILATVFGSADTVNGLGAFGSVVALLILVAFLVDCLMMLDNPLGQTVHDRMSGLQVVHGPVRAPRTSRADYPGCPVTVPAAIARGRVLRESTWGLTGVVWGLVIAFVVAVIVGAVLYLADAPTVAQVIVGLTVPWIVLAGWPVLATRRRGNGPVIDLGIRLTWSDVAWGVLGGVVALLVAAIAAAITEVFVPDLTSTAADAADDLQSSGRLAMLAFSLLVLVGAPIVEELFFRGLFFAALRKRGVGAVWTIVITAVVFAGYHLEPLRFFVLLPTGLVLGWVRWRTGSVGASMVTHGLVNAPAAVVLLLGVDGVSP